MSLHDMPRAARRVMVAGLLALAAPLALTGPALAASGPAPGHGGVFYITGTSRASGPRVAGSDAAANLPTAYDQHHQVLDTDPLVSDDYPQTCIHRTIGLDGGHYTLQEFIRPDNNGGPGSVSTGTPVTVFNNTTTENTWTWEDCLTPTPNGMDGIYELQTWLTAPDGSQQYLAADAGFANWCGATNNQCSQVWGSSLAPSSDVH